MKKQTLSAAARSDRMFNIILYTMMGLFAMIILYPLYFVVIASISDPMLIGSGEVFFLPKGLNIDGYKAILQDEKIYSGYYNSFLYAIVGTLIGVSATIAAAYPLSRPNLRGRKPIILYFTLTMFLNGGMIPTYIVIDELGLMNSIWAIVLPTAVTAYNLIIARTFLETTIPNELYEASSIDGCGHVRFFFRILLPLSTPIIAVLVLFSIVRMWNQYMNPMLYLQDQAKYPLQVVLRNILIQNTADIGSIDDALQLVEQMKLAEKIKYALIIVASVPVIAIYPFVQKHLVKGMMIGSVKG
ncbi:MAG: carbohydrate ABC transporter permease [Ruthenibacterium lactatiformans]